MSWQTMGIVLEGCGTWLLAIVTAVLGGFAVREYKQRSELERARWLAGLSRTFYEDKSYKEIRQAIDYEEVAAIQELLERDGQEGVSFSPDEKKLFDKFTDYLNFFELVAYLRKLNQLRERDVQAMFSYYLNRLRDVDPEGKVRKYISENGYEYLDGFLPKDGG